MTQTCWPAYPLRFTRAAGLDLAACPGCGEQLRTKPAGDLAGYRLERYAERSRP